MYHSLFIHSSAKGNLLLPSSGNYEESWFKYPCAGFCADSFQLSLFFDYISIKKKLRVHKKLTTLLSVDKWDKFYIL